MESEYSRLEGRIGYTFKKKELLVNALTHTSYANENNVEDNERVEFLGDAVLELASSEFLYNTMPDMSEGEMTKLRASLVCEPTLAMDAREIDLPDFLYLGKGEEITGGRRRDSIVSDAMESVIGAIFLDGGYDPARAFILKFIMNDIDHKKMFHDSKTLLQERIDSVKGGELKYEIVNETGPDHDKYYEAVAKLDEKIIGEGGGHTKKSAQQKAAYEALRKLGNVE